MKRSFKTMLGVTLLEIMLVLAIAATVIAMSVKYYQGASQTEHVNVVLDNITGIVAAGENFIQANGSFTTLTSSSLSPYLAGSSMPSSPWGGNMTISTASGNSYEISIPNVAGGNTCSIFANLVKQNPKLTLSSTCGAASGAQVIVVTE